MRQNEIQYKNVQTPFSTVKRSGVKIKVKLATIVESDPKVPFLIAATPRLGKGSTPFPGSLHFTLTL